MSERAASSPPTSRKRSHDGTVLQPTQNEVRDATGEASSPTQSSGTPSLTISLDRSRQASPAGSTTSSSLTDLTDLTGEASKPSLSAAPTKKRKLTFAEREVERAVRKQEKEARERQKAEDKARREEEKRLKDEEKRKREEEEKRLKDEEKRRREEEKEAIRRERELEKAEKQKVKEAEKRAKEDEKRKKEEDKEKKERSQMRIGTFFSRPKVPPTPPICNPDDVSSSVSSRRSSVVSLDDTEVRDIPSLSPTARITNPEYEKVFPPFFVHPNTELAPANRLLSSKADPEVATALSNPSLFSTWSNTAPDKSQHVQETFRFRLRAKQPSHKPKSVRSIVDQIQGSSTAPIDLTGEYPPLHLESLLDGVPLKVFSFHQDVRPDYHGTYTRPVSPRSKRSLARRPSARRLPDTDYDYDSEAEWEPPDDGDDVDAVDEESDSEEEEDDMEDFLDDEDDVGRRRLIVGDMDPVCSGLCWEGEAKKTFTSSGPFNMKEFEMEVINEEHCLPIDPYSTKYWVQSKPTLPPSIRSQLSSHSTNFMQPPRLPLHPSSQTNILLNPSPPITQNQHPCTTSTENGVSPLKSSLGQQSSQAAQKPLRLISNDLLPAFRQAVSGSDLNKVALVEILKKQFPKVSKDAIRDTLSTVAVRQGTKEAEKRWVLIDSL